MDLDSVLDSILSMGWVGFQICEILWIWIRIWIQIVHGLGWIMDLFFCLDLGLGLDSFFFSNPNPNP